MRFLDLLIMSVNNLRRRKLRTALTVLGVIIGTASIVVMVSLGIGLNEMTVERYASYGSLTTINIYSNAKWNMSSGSSGGEESSDILTDDVLKTFEQIPHVSGVSPVLSLYVIMKQGAYEAGISINGVSQEYLKQIPLGEGSLPKPGDDTLKLVYGNMVKTQFRNSKTGEGYWDNQKIPEVDFNKPMFVIFDRDAYYSSQHGSAAGVKPPKKYMIETAGVVEGGIEDYNNYSYSVYADIDALEAELKKIFRKKAIPDQPLNKKGKPYPYLIYDQAVVFVDDMENVVDVQKQLTDMGYQANSQMEWLEQSKEQTNMVQAVLGGIGAVSLFVAAIGIANTMMMSIYERTKEIGVMKVLGCDMGNIRNMFLIESGFIGFMGGVIGIGLSFGISMIINKFAGASALMGGIEGDLSRIPSWLYLSAIGFAVFVGMAAGFLPALRAMRLSPLAAIRNE